MRPSDAVRRLKKMHAEAASNCVHFKETIDRAIKLHREDAALRNVDLEDQLPDEEIGTRARERLRFWEGQRDALAYALDAIDKARAKP